jgi:outer membrane protein assembly factor BamA
MMFVCVVSCSVTGKLPPNEKLYTGGKVKIDDRNKAVKKEKELENELEGLLRPKPNTRLLGIPYKLMFYNLIDTVPRKKGLKHFIKNKLGEPPVLFSEVSVEANNDILINRLENRGYFRTRSTAEIIDKVKKVKVIYKPVPGIQYHIRDVRFLLDSTTELGAAVQNTVPETFLKPGDPYDLDVIKAERERIDARLKENGFYFFSPDDIIVQVDSTEGDHQVDMFVRIKPVIPEKARRIYRINNTYILPNYSLSDETLNLEDAKWHGDFFIVDPENKWKPLTFERFTHFDPGDVYNRTDHNLALSNMVSLGAFKFVKNRFDELEDSARLNVFYFLTPFPKKSIRLELTGKKTDADFTGTELNINWRNRNTFRGAELLTISAYGGTDIQAGGNESLSNNRSYYKFGAQVTLSVPRFITPFRVRSGGAFVPKTRFTLGYDFLKRRNSYTLNSFRALTGYHWKESIRTEHELNVIDINYVQPVNVTSLYRMLAESDPTLKKAIERQFTIGPGYRYTTTNTTETNKIHTTYYMGALDLSGNILGLVTDANIREGEPGKLLGAVFSQYIKMENDFRYYLKLGEHSKLANRVFAGFGYAYGNSVNLPFVKQFFVGGSNSVRAFRARAHGPGTYYAPDDPQTTSGFTADQSGDIKLELSTEYRKRLAGIMHGALFVDAGNIWLLRQDLDPEARKEGAVFSRDFMKELLVGGGAGLRFDFSFVILRLDLAIPFRKPWLPEGERWVFDKIRFGDPGWRKENLVFNLAIGYPY